jgi:hypothetical protein
MPFNFPIKPSRKGGGLWINHTLPPLFYSKYSYSTKEIVESSLSWIKKEKRQG